MKKKQNDINVKFINGLINFKRVNPVQLSHGDLAFGWERWHHGFLADSWQSLIMA